MPWFLWIPLLFVAACSDDAVPLPGGEGRISVFERERSILSQLDPQNFTYPLLPPEQHNLNWTQSGGTPSTQKGHLQLASSPTQAWQVGVSKLSPFLSGPIVAQGSVFVFDTQTATVNAWKTENGDPLWTVSLLPEQEEGETLNGGIAWAQGVLYVSTGYADLFALNAVSGEIIWQRGLPAPPRGAPTVFDNLLYLTTTDSRILAFFTADGGLSWEYSGLIEFIGLLKSSSPATNGQVVLVGTPAGEIICLNAQTGSLLWADDLTQEDNIGRILPEILGQPVIFDQDAYVISHSGLLVAFDLQQGSRLWERRVSSLHTPWLVQDTLYVLTTRNELIAFHRQDGRTLWFTQLQRYQDEEKQDERILWSGPILGGGKLWLANSERNLIGLNALTGLEEVRYSTQYRLSLAPIIADQTLYLLSQNGILTAFR